MFKKIDHIKINTGKFDDTLQFYQDVLGFTLKTKESSDLAMLQLGDCMVEIKGCESDTPPPSGQEHLGYRMMALEVEDMGQTAAYLREKGIDFRSGPVTLGLFVQAEIVDPNGIPIALRQWLAPLPTV